MGIFFFAKGMKRPRGEFQVKIMPEVLEALKQKLSESGKSAVRFELEDFG